jgi:hypothetical protein
MLYRLYLIAIMLLLTGICNGQNPGQDFTRQDTLRGSVTPEREWWDLTFYHLDLVTNPVDSSL